MRFALLTVSFLTLASSCGGYAYLTLGNPAQNVKVTSYQSFPKAGKRSVEFLVYLRLASDDFLASRHDSTWARRACEPDFDPSEGLDGYGFQLCVDVRRELENLGFTVSTDPTVPHHFEFRLKTETARVDTNEGLSDIDAAFTSDLYILGRTTQLGSARILGGHVIDGRREPIKLLSNAQAHALVSLAISGSDSGGYTGAGSTGGGITEILARAAGCQSSDQCVDWSNFRTFRNDSLARVDTANLPNAPRAAERPRVVVNTTSKQDTSDANLWLQALGQALYSANDGSLDQGNPLRQQPTASTATEWRPGASEASSGEATQTSDDGNPLRTTRQGSSPMLSLDGEPKSRSNASERGGSSSSRAAGDSSREDSSASQPAKRARCMRPGYTEKIGAAHAKDRDTAMSRLEKQRRCPNPTLDGRAVDGPKPELMNVRCEEITYGPPLHTRIEHDWTCTAEISCPEYERNCELPKAVRQ